MPCVYFLKVFIDGIDVVRLVNLALFLLVIIGNVRHNFPASEASNRYNHLVYLSIFYILAYIIIFYIIICVV